MTERNSLRQKDNSGNSLDGSEGGLEESVESWNSVLASSAGKREGIGRLIGSQIPHVLC